MTYVETIAKRGAALLADLTSERAVEAVIETVVEELVERCAKVADRYRSALSAELDDRGDTAQALAAEEIAAGIRALAAPPAGVGAEPEPELATWAFCPRCKDRVATKFESGPPWNGKTVFVAHAAKGSSPRLHCRESGQPAPAGTGGRR